MSQVEKFLRISQGDWSPQDVQDAIDHLQRTRDLPDGGVEYLFKDGSVVTIREKEGIAEWR